MHSTDAIASGRRRIPRPPFIRPVMIHHGGTVLHIIHP